MKERMKKLLFELLKDSKSSDRELAKVLGVSQPTVTRMRSRLTQEGVIKEYTIIPDFVKMGYEIMAITTVRAKTRRELTEKGKKSVMARPNIIFATRAKGGMGKNGLFISLHKNYLDFDNFLTEYFQEWGDDIEEHETMLISLGGLIVKPFSFKYLAEAEKT